jgi:hypothetical protein
MSTKLLIVPKESTKRTLMTPGVMRGVEHIALTAESSIALDEYPSEKTQRIPDDEGNLCISAKMRTCEFGRSNTSGDANTRAAWLLAELDTNVAFEANEWCEHGSGPGHTRTKNDSKIWSSN